MVEAKRISAVVISYHGIGFIEDCLATLTAELSNYPHEIIVVDNGSVDGTIEYIESDHPDITLIKNGRNLGFARAVNQGMAAASLDFLWILNQDIRIRPGCLKALLACYDALDAPGMIGPRFVGFDGRLQKLSRRFPTYHHLLCELTGMAYLFPRTRAFNGWKMGDFDHTTSRPIEQPMGAAILVARDRIERIGDFDESFGIFFNDVDFCYRLQQAGYVNYYCADAVIEHFVGGSVSRHKPKMVWLSHVSMFRYFLKREKHRPGSTAIRLLRRPLPYLAGLLLIIAAVPRSLYHLLKKLT